MIEYLSSAQPQTFRRSGTETLAPIESPHLGDQLLNLPQASASAAGAQNVHDPGRVKPHRLAVTDLLAMILRE